MTPKIPNAEVAGDWHVNVSLNSKRFYSESVRMKCPVGLYEGRDLEFATLSPDLCDIGQWDRSGTEIVSVESAKSSELC